MLWHLLMLWRNCWRHDVMTSWQTFLNHDICLTSRQTFYIMTYLWLHDKPLTLWQSFWRHGVFLMSWRTWWRHNELCDVITFSFNNKLDIMTSFVTSCRTIRTFLFEIMMTFLTSWQTFWHHDVFMTSWRIFDVTNCLTSCRMLHFLTSWLTFCAPDIFILLFREQNIMKTCFWFFML